MCFCDVENHNLFTFFANFPIKRQEDMKSLFFTKNATEEYTNDIDTKSNYFGQIYPNWYFLEPNKY